MVHQVVQVVAPERLDGEHRPVAAPSGALPLVAGDRGVGGRGLGGALDEVDDDLAGVLLVVVLLDGRGVLVPVLEVGVVLVEHQVHAAGEDLVHVTDVAGVLQPRPHVRGGAYGAVGVGRARRTSPRVFSWIRSSSCSRATPSRS